MDTKIGDRPTEEIAPSSGPKPSQHTGTASTRGNKAPQAQWYATIFEKTPSEPLDDVALFERDTSSRSHGPGPYIAFVLVMLLPTAALVSYLWWNWADPDLKTVPYLTVLFLAELLASLLLVARWFQRLTSNSDIEELRKMAFSYRLGGVLALRPFLHPHGEKLTAESPLSEYRKGIIEPNFYKTATNPPFFLALTLVVSLGLFAFYAQTLGLLGLPTILLLGPEIHGWNWQLESSNTSELQRFTAYGAGALVCVAFSFGGALVWAVIYITRRMALRDVTAYTYQEVTMRLVAAAVLSLIVYHIVAPVDPSPGMPWSEILMTVAFGIGIMPETVLRWLGNKAARWFGGREETDYLDLEHIHGISAFTRTRLAEVGIYDAQGLVTNNPLRLSLHTPYSVPQIMDWIGQAFLLLQFGPSTLLALRKKGVRTVWELIPVISHIGAEATLKEITPQTLDVLRANPNFVRASEIQARMLGEAPATD